ncbi:MAG: GNAT family N-acetyltransferase [bacterium]
MMQINTSQTATLEEWFVPDRPGPLVGLHVIQTGNGACFVDRWPNPRAVLVDSAGNYSLAGEAEVLTPVDLKDRIAGFVEAPEPFVPLLKAAFPELKVWHRVIMELPGKPSFSLPRTAKVRQIESGDTCHLWGLSPEVAWICKTWGGPAGLASSGHAWGAFADGRLVSVACTFYVGVRYEDIAVVTEPEFRGLGLSGACAGALCADIQSRGRRPSWQTSPDNTASLRVAQKLGFTLSRHDCHYVIGVPIPEPARRQAT